MVTIIAAQYVRRKTASLSHTVSPRMRAERAAQYADCPRQRRDDPEEKTWHAATSEISAAKRL
jgi:hypothetical protein